MENTRQHSRTPQHRPAVTTPNDNLVTALACPDCPHIRAAKAAIVDLLGALMSHDLRGMVHLSRRIARLCPWLRGV